MGNSQLNKFLSPEEIEQIKTDNQYSEGSGTLTLNDFKNIPELSQNPLLDRVIEIFDTNKDNQIQFIEFIKGLSIFNSKGNKEKKLRFAFQIYDLDGDGFISNSELFRILKMMTGNNLTDIQLQQIVDKTILEADKDKDGLVSYEEFIQMIGNTEDIESKLTINF